MPNSGRERVVARGVAEELGITLDKAIQLVRKARESRPNLRGEALTAAVKRLLKDDES